MLHRVAEEVFVVEVGETEAGVEGFGLRFVDVDDEADCCMAQEIEDRYVDYPGDKLLPFESSERFNGNIKIIFEKAEVTYLVTELDNVTRAEKKVPINEIASSHMTRRTFIGNIYKLVQDPNLISALTGDVEGSRAFSRYRTIDMDMKMDLVKILEGAK